MKQPPAAALEEDYEDAIIEAAVDALNCNDAAGWDRSAPFASLVAALLDAEAEMAGAA